MVVLFIAREMEVLAPFVDHHAQHPLVVPNTLGFLFRRHQHHVGSVIVPGLLPREIEWDFESLPGM